MKTYFIFVFALLIVFLCVFVFVILFYLKFPKCIPSSVEKLYNFSLSSDNLRYGIKFAKRFIDAPDKKLLKKTGEMR